MKTIILCEIKENVDYVYPEYIMNELNCFDFNGKTYSKNDVTCNSDLFKDTEYIFSTWGMPAFSEEEIIRCFPNLKCVFYAAGTVQ